MIDNSRDFLESIAGYVNSPTQGPMPSVERPTRLGIIDPYYTSGPARVLFDGEDVISQRGYSWVGSYSPVNSERVFLIPVGQTYIIGGAVTSDVPYARWLANAQLNGWTNYDTANYHPAYMTKTTSGVVKFAGLIRSGTIDNNTPIMYIPEEFRPPIDMVFPMITNGKAGTIVVTALGYVSVSQWADNAWLSLSNITYPTEVLTWNDVTLQNSFGVSPSPFDLGEPQWAKDSYGRVWFRGATSKVTQPGADTTMFNIPSTARPNRTHHVIASTLDGISNFGFVDISSAGDVRWKFGSTTTHLSLAGTHFLDKDSGWTSPSLVNGWTNLDSATFTGAGYYKDADGVVYLKGLMAAGTIGTAIFTLPAGFRPTKTIIRETASIAALGRVDIQATGGVVATNGTNGWFSLDGIAFNAEQ